MWLVATVLDSSRGSEGLRFKVLLQLIIVVIGGPAFCAPAWISNILFPLIHTH